MARIEMRPSRTAGLGLLLFLLGVITGRLILERSGEGFIVFLVTLPVLLAILIALFGVGPGVLLATLFAGTAILIRSVVLYSAAGWVVLLLAPAAAVTVYIMVNTLRAMRHDRGSREGQERPHGAAAARVSREEVDAREGKEEE